MTTSSLTSAPVIAAFDFDGTLTTRDTLLPFIRFCHGIWPATISVAATLHACALFLMGLQSRQGVKETLLDRSFRGILATQMQAWGEAFAAQAIQRYLRPQAMRRLAWHQQQGHVCILVSANLGVYLRPWAAQQGFASAICSELAINAQGRMTGRLVGLNCWGPEKARRLLAVLGDRPRSSYTLYAYGDSRGDRELLAAADYAYYRYWPTECLPADEKSTA